jgi:hypothetical protein
MLTNIEHASDIKEFAIETVSCGIKVVADRLKTEFRLERNITGILYHFAKDL